MNYIQDRSLQRVMVDYICSPEGTAYHSRCRVSQNRASFLTVAILQSLWDDHASIYTSLAFVVRVLHTIVLHEFDIALNVSLL